VDEGARDGDHAQVWLPLYLISGTLAYWWPRNPLYARYRNRRCSASSARVFTLLISALKRLVTSCPVLLGVSVQMHGVGVPASDSQSYLHSHHSLDSVAEMVARAASATVSNVVGMIGTEAGLSGQTATMKVQWCVSPIDVLPTSCQPFPVTVFFLLASISSTRQMRRSSRRRTYFSLACNASSHSPTASRGIPSLSTTPSRSKPTRGFNRACACTGPTQRCPKPSQPARDAEPRVACASCGPHLPPYPETLRFHLR
jgi:hypothetical protein